LPSVRDLRQKVKSVKSTQQITKAMKMVSAARLQRAQARILAARPFANEMETLLRNACLQLFSDDRRLCDHPFLFSQEGSQGRLGVVVVTADKGLCGSFNTNVLRRSVEFISKQGMKEIRLFAVGRKGRDFFRGAKMAIADEYLGIFGRLSFAHAELIGKAVMKAYTDTPLEAIYLIYNEFKSLVQQNLVIRKLLPVSADELKHSGGDEENRSPIDYLYEPDQQQLLDALLPRFIKSQIYRALLESGAAELAARMTAMDSASRNASELIDSLTLTMNKVRQAVITKELSELVAGAEALK